MRCILIANIFGIGDVLFTTPLAANLKERFEGVSVDYLCNARVRGLLEYVPDIDEVTVYEKDALMKTWKGSKRAGAKALWDMFSRIRSRRYDAVFDFTMSREFGLLFAAAGIKRRFGLDYRRRGIFLTDKLPLDGFEGRHVIEHYLDLLELADVPVDVRNMQLVPDENGIERASVCLAEKCSEGGPLVAVVPGGGASWGEHAVRKRWDPAAFGKAAEMIAQRGGSVAILGDASEKNLCERVARDMSERTAFVENGLSLKDYAALLSLCDLVLCNDGGPLHMAVALGVGTVSIFGPVDDVVYGPFPSSGKHRVMTAGDVPCRPCYGRFKLPECDNDMRCLTGISPEKVADACMEQLGQIESEDGKEI